MSSLNDTAELAAAELPGGLVSAGGYASYADAFERSVVVLATENPCWIVADESGHHLLVEPGIVRHVRDQIARYDRESIGWPPPPLVDEAARRPWELLTPLGWAVSVLALFRLQTTHPAWAREGAVDPVAIFGEGEWWRAATALFLHADAEHVISNLLGGILVFSAVTTTLGRWRGWLAVATATVLGNLVVAALNAGRDYRSLGSSTAIFAGLGVLLGRAVRFILAHRTQANFLRALFVPITASCTVLALYGAGTGNVDVPAHACGFAAGVLVGFLVPDQTLPTEL